MMIEFDKCLIATGGSPKRLQLPKESPLSLSDRVFVLRDSETVTHFSEQLSKKGHMLTVMYTKEWMDGWMP